jgi:stress-induced-phosphoprotein 1
LSLILLQPDVPAPAPRDSAADKKKAEEEAKKRAEEEAKKKAAADFAALPQNKRDAVAEKEKGTAAYKKRDFETALSHYTRAMELDPDEMTYVLNRAAAQLEKGDFAACVQDGEKAIEIGRAHRADFKQIARAYARIGNAFAKQEKWELAIQNYNKSLTEDRTGDVLDALRKAEKELKTKQDREYRDPAKAEEANKLGNEAFKSHQYPDAVKHYSEAVKRNPEDPKLFSNRAAAYTKLMAYAEALKDCEECLKLNPSFVKGYIRKGFVHFAMKDYNKALETYDKGLLLDPNNEELKNNIQQVLDRVNEGGDAEARERAMKSPEIQAILQDPVMMSILREMQENPSSMQKYLKDDKVRQNIEKLVAAGIVQTKSRSMPGAPGSH